MLAMAPLSHQSPVLARQRSNGDFARGSPVVELKQGSRPTPASLSPRVWQGVSIPQVTRSQSMTSNASSLSSPLASTSSLPIYGLPTRPLPSAIQRQGAQAKLAAPLQPRSPRSSLIPETKRLNSPRVLLPMTVNGAQSSPRSHVSPALPSPGIRPAHVAPMSARHAASAGAKLSSLGKRPPATASTAFASDTRDNFDSYGTSGCGGSVPSSRPEARRSTRPSVSFAPDVSSPSSSGCLACRESMRKVIRSDSGIVRFAERVPLVNNVIQKVHQRHEDDAALDRAERRNPLGHHGYITRAVERLPGVNNVVQKVHARRGDTAALARAKERNPLGRDGYITKTAELIPGVSDALVHWYRKHDGYEEAAERAAAHTAAELFGRDGPMTRAAELIPGSHLVVAALHQAVGHPEEAKRALHLLQNWKDAGSRDGALTKLAELCPGVDIIPFAVHLAAGHYPQALRSVVKTSRVSIGIASVVSAVSLPTVRDVVVLDIDTTDVSIHPKGVSVVGALFDVSTNFLRYNREGARRKQRKSSKPVSHQNGASCQDPVRWSHHPGRRMRGELNDLVLRLVNEQVGAMLEQLQRSIPDVVVWIVNAIMEDARKKHWLLRCILAPLPELTPPLEETMRASIPGLMLHHGDFKLPEAARAALLPAKKDHITKPQRHFTNGQQKIPEMSLGTCCCLAGAAGLGSLLKTALIGPLACLAGVAGLAACGGFGGRAAGRRLPNLLAKLNRQSWQAAADRDSAFKTRSARKHAESTRAGARVAQGTPAPTGLFIEMRSEDIRSVSPPCRSWVLRRLLRGRGGLLTCLEGPAKAYLASFFMEGAAGHVPLVIEVVIPSWNATGPPLDVIMPAIPLTVSLDLSFIDDGYVRSGKVFVGDATIDEIVGAIQRRMQSADLRQLDPSLASFAAPVHADFAYALRWPQPSSLEVHISNVRTDLSLPD
eukprot:TRINITY_DN29236_c1_g2_i1.p1 TRINITY_DN29236_c1_g2~~TRINITY_DN29236_c1_g2_i1.p1  ORF type:complete len:944 (-),score=101.93 TRINITY_DN29236_c1_g2_i1:78-2909(-)